MTSQAENRKPALLTRLLPYLLAFALLAAAVALADWLITGRDGLSVWGGLLLALAAALAFRPLLTLSRRLLKYRPAVTLAKRLDDLEKLSLAAESGAGSPPWDVLVENLKDSFGASSVYLLRRIFPGGELCLEAGTDIEYLPPPDQFLFSAAFGDALCRIGGFVYRQGEPLPESLGPLAETDAACLNLLNARVVAPVIKAGVLSGVLLLGPAQSAEEYSLEDMQILRIIVAQVAAEMDCQRLQAELQSAGRGAAGGGLREKSRRLAHDFGNIITTILGMAQLARRQSEDEKIREKLELIERAAGDGRGMVEDFRREDEITVEPDLSEASAPRPVTVAPSDVTGAAPRILVVEAGRESAFVMADALAHQGYLTESASTAADALDLGTRHFYDLVLLDADMSGASGWEMAARLREHSRATRILFITADGADLDPLKLMENHISGVIIRPVTPEELLSKVRRGLKEAIPSGNISGGRP